MVFVDYQILDSLFLFSKIRQDVREYAKEQNFEKEKALAVGTAEKAAEFKVAGSEIYHGNVSYGAKGLY